MCVPSPNTWSDVVTSSPEYGAFFTVGPITIDRTAVGLSWPPSGPSEAIAYNAVNITAAVRKKGLGIRIAVLLRNPKCYLRCESRALVRQDRQSRPPANHPIPN